MWAERLCFSRETAIVGFATEIGGMVEAHIEDDGFVGVGAEVQFLLMKPYVGGEERLCLSAFADTIEGVTVALVIVVEQLSETAFEIHLQPLSGARDGDEFGCEEICCRCSDECRAVRVKTRGFRHQALSTTR